MGVKSFTTKIFWNLGCALLGMLLELEGIEGIEGPLNQIKKFFFYQIMG